jgi:C4-dicarboxylate-specific signal transduction histidine kinase
MEDERGYELRISQLAFVGKILASFTHELKNHLAIIKESAGLQQDLITFGGRKPKIDSGEMLKFLKSVDDEIQKTLALITFLNRYAHRMDSETSTFSVNAVLDELIALTDRLARRERITFVREFDPADYDVCSNPSRLQLILFCIIERLLKTLDQKSTVVFRTGHSEGGVVISIIPQGQTGPLGEEDTLLCTDTFIDETMRDLSGTITRGGQGGEVTITLPSVSNA